MKYPVFRRRLTQLFAFLALGAFLTACETIRTGSHYDETTNFGAYQTFSWIDENPYIGDGSAVRISPLAQSKIQRAIQTQLEQLGYSFIEDRDDADFVLAYTVGTRDRIRVDSYPAAYRGSWGWHVHGSYYYVNETTVHSYKECTLGFDMFDGK